MIIDTIRCPPAALGIRLSKPMGPGMGTTPATCFAGVAEPFDWSTLLMPGSWTRNELLVLPVVCRHPSATKFAQCGATRPSLHPYRARQAFQYPSSRPDESCFFAS